MEDWEADTAIGKQGGAVPVTLAERKSQFSMIIKAQNKSAATTKAMAPHAANVHTLTYNTGKEFAYHKRVSDRPQAQGSSLSLLGAWAERKYEQIDPPVSAKGQKLRRPEKS